MFVDEIASLGFHTKYCISLDDINPVKAIVYSKKNRGNQQLSNKIF